MNLIALLASVQVRRGEARGSFEEDEKYLRATAETNPLSLNSQWVTFATTTSTAIVSRVPKGNSRNSWDQLLAQIARQENGVLLSLPHASSATRGKFQMIRNPLASLASEVRSAFPVSRFALSATTHRGLWLPETKCMPANFAIMAIRLSQDRRTNVSAAERPRTAWEGLTSVRRVPVLANSRPRGLPTARPLLPGRKRTRVGPILKFVQSTLSVR